MKKLKRWFKDIFDPQDFNNLDVDAIRGAFNDTSIRTIWLTGCFDELKRINLEVDRRLLSGTDLQLTDLCARRKAYQDILESVLSARRQVTQEQRPNQKSSIDVRIDLDKLTA